MKKLYLLLGMCICMTSAFAGDDVYLNISHVLGEDLLEFNTQTSANTTYPYEVTRAQYYLSQFEIVHDGGMVTSVPDTWLLIDASADFEFLLGNFDVTTIEGINFSVGVEPDYNHLDPATYPLDHPLAYTFPAMHWGWSAGYRFFCMEGNAGTGLANLWQIHALGDANYHQVSLSGAATKEGSEQTFFVKADYSLALTGIDLSAGLIEHSETGQAAVFLENVRDYVFSRIDSALGTPATTAIETLELPQFQLAPNPVAAGTTQLQIGQVPDANYDFTITDLSGRIIHSQNHTGGQQILLNNPLDAGYYIVGLQLDNGQSTYRSLIVTR